MNVRLLVGCNAGNPDKKIPKFEDWNELKFVVFLRRQDYSKRLGKLGINDYITSKYHYLQC